MPPFGRQLQPVTIEVSGGEWVDRVYWSNRLRALLKHQPCMTDHADTLHDKEIFKIYPDANND